MNASARFEVLREPDQFGEHHGDQRVDTVLQELCSDEQLPPRNPVRLSIRDVETFAGGAGI